MNRSCLVFAALLAATALSPAFAAPSGRNVVIFVADGLRYDSVTPDTAPTLARIRREGVDFANSHSVYPTLTMVNASAIATGHMPGDNGNYANTFYVGFAVPCADGAPLAFVEDNCILKDIKAHFPADYLAQTTLIEAARKAGLNTVLVGKKGPLAVQFLPALDSKNDGVDGPLGVFMDEAAGRPATDGKPTFSPPLSGSLAADVQQATGLAATPGTSVPNLTQQAYQISAVTQVLVPRLKASGKPFAMLFWSRDPDVTQHNAADSEGKLVPGINATSAYTAIYGVDANLKALIDSLKQWGLADNTDIIVVADHGFSTIGKGLPTPEGGLQSISLPAGFLALDVADWLQTKVFDPAAANAEVDIASGEHPKTGNAVIGPTAEAPEVLVVSNGNTEYLYIPERPDARAIARTLVAKLAGAAYTGALFVNDRLIDGRPQDFAGALPMREIGLIGSSKVPQPAIVVGFRTFDAQGCEAGALLCAVEVSDTTLNTGHGNHGSFSRADTRNFMAAIGPDFKAGYRDETPVGNIDVAHTAAKLLGIELPGPGSLKGRVWGEALVGGSAPKTVVRRLESPPTADGIRTVLKVQEVGPVRYIDAGGIPGRMVGLED